MSNNVQENDDKSKQQELARIASAIEKLTRRFDEFAGAFLNGKFPHGRPDDSWSRRG